MRRASVPVRRDPVLSSAAVEAPGEDGPFLMAERRTSGGGAGPSGSGGGGGRRGTGRRGTGKGGSGDGGSRPPRRWLRRAGIALGVVALIFAGYIAWVLRDLPSLDELNKPAAEPGITVLARDGTAIAVYGRLTGRQITVNDLPPALVEAVKELAAEARGAPALEGSAQFL